MKSKLLLIACCLFLGSCGNKSQQQQAQVPDYAVGTVQSSDMDLTNSYPATIKGKLDVEIRPMVTGFITKLNVDEGSIVKKGQSLFTIDPVQYQAAVNAAKASVATAQAALNNQQIVVNNKKALYQKQIISNYDLEMAENQLDQAKAALQQAKSQLTNAENNLRYTHVLSPCDGVVGSIPFRVGSLVSPSSPTPLTTISNISDMYAYFSMTERDLLGLMKKGGNMQEILQNMPPVQLQLIDGSIYDKKGKIETISGVIDPTTGTVRLRALFPNENNILRSGGTGNVLVPTVLKNAIRIPQTATVEIQDKKFVFVVQPDNTVKNTEVQVAPLDDGKYYWVTSGLKPGEKIVLEGVQNLKNDQKINPITPAQKEEEYQKAIQDQKDGNIETAFK